MTRGRFRRWSVALLALALGAMALRAHAHPVDAALLSLTEVGQGRFSITWQAGSSTLERFTEPALFPRPCRIEGAFLECGSAGLAGAIEFPWLEGSLTHLVVEIEWRDDTHLLRTVNADAPRLLVYGGARGASALGAVARDYARLGVEHIWGGFDHLLFVIALTLLIGVTRRLIATVTAFTVGHSVSLVATSLGVVSVPAPPVEAIIALSIAWVCAEGARPRDALVSRAPWVVALLFGLLHGLGFASALLDIGLPAQHVPLALAFFNVGVELGQLAVIGVLLLLQVAVARARWRRDWQRVALFYAMGSVAMAWSIERVAAVLVG